MRKIIYFLFIFVLFCSGVVIKEFPLRTKQHFNLTGNVKFMSEKSVLIHIDTNLNYTIDTMESNGLIKNCYFNHLGVLESTYYIKNDSIILSKTKYYDNRNGNKIFCIKYEAKKTIESRFISFKDSILILKHYDTSNNKLEYKSWVKEENSQIIWMKSKLFKYKLISEYVYERDQNGNEITIKQKFGKDKNQEYYILKIKYLEWDSVGNWTKRIEYNEFDMNGTLVTREINYYN